MKLINVAVEAERKCGANAWVNKAPAEEPQRNGENSENRNPFRQHLQIIMKMNCSAGIELQPFEH